jgi:hypothetical protein
MNVRKLVILLMTIALGALSAPAQEGAGSVTFTDHSNQSVSISRFGTVLKLKNSNGKEIVPNNIYRVCACGEKGPCIESANLPGKETKSQFEVVFPKEGATLKKGETLVLAATFREGELTVKRRLTWEAGSGAVIVDEVISSSKSLCLTTFEPQPEIVTVRLVAKMCPRPPGDPYFWICPPFTEMSQESMQMMTSNAVHNFVR